MAEDRIRDVVEATLLELDLRGPQERIVGPESCLTPSGDVRSVYTVVLDDMEGQPVTFVREVRGYWNAVAGDWTDGEFVVSGDVAATTLEFDGLKVVVALIDEGNGLMIMGATACYGAPAASD